MYVLKKNSDAEFGNGGVDKFSLQSILSEFFSITYIRELLGLVVGCVDGVNNHDAEFSNGNTRILMIISKMKK